MENITKYADMIPQNDTATTLELATDDNKSNENTEVQKDKTFDNTLIIIVAIVIGVLIVAFIAIKAIKHISISHRHSL